ncbi:hypothetical protein [Phytohabitans houttuyneae]|uniref:Uncharacterized protein n=1 Tax=Phytohabitans houttuyneae TaxID=1076126 RepID=A0A6V8KHZ0_9ACTN|nr:hypothetical protein [Phytohabitans houttuyneae]GFJ84813.1 hypothetical protein Phou_089930 [Phytohabitans houttuyneae]
MVLAAPAAAWAHGGDAPDATNYRTLVTEAPSMPGLSVRAVEAGARLELDNRTGRTIEVLGYDGEPYLEVRPDGVYENTRSPATYLNETLAGDTEPPATADPTQPPEWRRASGEPVARWHDHRIHWMSAEPPPAVRADPSREQRVRDWVVPLRDGVSTMEVRGTLDWVPPPSPGLWWAFVIIVGIGVAVLGLWSRALPVLAGLAIALGPLAIGYAVARELDAGTTGVGPVLVGLLVGQVWPVATALAAVAAGILALRRRPAADFALALGGTCVAVFAGAANAAVFARGVVPVPWPPVVARLVILAVIAVGGGVAVAAALRMREAARSAAQDDAEEPATS